MTEEAKAAKRLYDAEKWAEAHAALLRVANGETGDDARNRQLAAYYLAICAERMKDHEQAFSRLEPVAKDPGHPKHDAAIFWLVRVARQPALAERFIDLMPRCRPSSAHGRSPHVRAGLGALRHSADGSPGRRLHAR